VAVEVVQVIPHLVVQVEEAVEVQEHPINLPTTTEEVEEIP
jgi:hypothetical protein